MKILVTGFEPFGGEPENASGEAVRQLSRRWSGAAEVVVGLLPVSFAGAPPALHALVEQHRPDAVVAVGEAGGRGSVTPERFGRNRIDARIPDNDGAQPRDLVIDDGPELRPATLDVEELVRRIRTVGVPAEVSQDAGAFVCNVVAVEVAALGLPAAFVHVPAVRTVGRAAVGTETDDGGWSPEQTLSFDDLVRALSSCVDAAIAAVAAARNDDPAMVIREVTADDHTDWLALWNGYLTFYEEDLPERTTAVTFGRIADPDGPIHGAIARADNGTPLGLVHWHTHSGTWNLGLVCYLEDLYVAPEGRRQGVGEQLITHVRGWAAAHGCDSLYWQTKADNVTARRLYDRLATEVGYVRYEITPL